jgi:hypothetical protein
MSVSFIISELILNGKRTESRIRQGRKRRQIYSHFPHTPSLLIFRLKKGVPLVPIGW